ncbi:unnamed protein product [Sphagnum jensenii]
MVCHAKQYYYNNVALRELALTPNSSPEFQAKNATNNTQSFWGNGSMESDDQRASRHRLLHAEARSADGKSVSGMQRCGGRERSAAPVRCAHKSRHLQPSFAAHRQNDNRNT